MEPQERRKKTRVHFATLVTVKTDTSEIVTDANSEDISMKGVFVRTDQEIPVGTPCDMEILLTGTSRRLALNIKGVITRQDSSGLGIAFDSMDLDSYVHLKNILLYNASDSEEIRREMFSLK